MNVLSDLPPTHAGDATTRPAADVVLHHPVFCQLGLPVRAPGKGVWRREFGPAALSIEGADEAPLPFGRYLRLLLIYIFDTAIRTDSHQVELGEDVAALALKMEGETKPPQLAELAEQVSRVVGARVTVASDGGAPLSVFDARGRQRVAASGWRPAIRLNARFFASLGGGAVELERAVVTALAEAPAALDIHAWLAWARPDAGPDAEVAASWEELRQRFGDPDQPEGAFRSEFTESLALLQHAWPALTGVITDDGVTFRRGAVPAVAPRAAASEEEVSAPRGHDQKRRQRSEPMPPPAAVDPVAAEPLPESMPESMPEAIPAPSQDQALERPADARPRALRQSISLRSHLTGLQQVVWLQRANGREIPVIEVTPGGRYDPESVTVIALEPLTLQVSGGLYTRDFERVAAWATANRDLIEDWWDGRIDSFENVAERVRKVPAPGWR